mmetsp:Transcript_11943/g.18229  ORF Transcript_11943/g.18229 Transcript_11943/m.18229 type:complete len:112 (+) Transcript_11943:123-458(+)
MGQNPRLVARRGLCDKPNIAPNGATPCVILGHGGCNKYPPAQRGGYTTHTHNKPWQSGLLAYPTQLKPCPMNWPNKERQHNPRHSCNKPIVNLTPSLCLRTEQVSSGTEQR